MGYENLSLEHQAYIIDRMEKKRVENDLKIKLCLVGNTAQERIYRYAVKELNVTTRKEGEKME